MLQQHSACCNSMMPCSKSTTFAATAPCLLQQHFPAATVWCPAARAQCMMQQHGAGCNSTVHAVPAVIALYVVGCNSTLPAATSLFVVCCNSTVCCLLQQHCACYKSTLPSATAQCLLQQHRALQSAVSASTAWCLLQQQYACCKSTITVAIGVFCNSRIPDATAWRLLYGIAYFLQMQQFRLLQQQGGAACCNIMMPLLLLLQQHGD